MDSSMDMFRAPEDANPGGWGENRVRAVYANSQGGLLVEVIIALAVLVLTGSAVMGGTSMAQRSLGQTESLALAENIARNQMEYVFTLPYQPPPSTYEAITAPQGYEVEAVAETVSGASDDVEKVVVTVSHTGRQVLVLETMRLR